MARATSSLPVPLSPCTSTVLLVAATVRITCFSLWMAGLLPMMLSSELWLAASRRKAKFCRRSACVSRAWVTASLIFST